MSIKVMNAVWQDASCEGGALLVLLALADFADEEGNCFPSIAVLAYKSRMSTRSVKRHISDLTNDGVIRVVKKGVGRGNRSVYRIKFDSFPPRAPLKKVTNEVSDDEENGDKHDTEMVTSCPEMVTDATSHIENHQGTIIESSESRTRKPIDILIADGSLSRERAKDWIEHRRLKKAPLGERAAKLCALELRKLEAKGVRPDDAVDVAIEAGWQAVKFDWVLNRVNGRGPAPANDVDKSARRLLDAIKLEEGL